MLRPLFFFLAFSTSNFLLSQLTAEDSIKIDDWKKIVNSDVHDSLRINAMIFWKHKIKNVDYKKDSALSFEMLRLSNDNLQKKLNKNERTYFLVAKGKAHNEIGVVYMDQGNCDSSIHHMKLAIHFYQLSNTIAGQDGAYINMGHCYGSMGKIPEAMDAYKKGIEVTEQTGNERFKSYALMSIGGCYRSIGEEEKALKYFEKTFTIAQELGDHYGMAGSCLNMASLHYALESRDSAFYYYALGIQEAEKIGQFEFISAAYLSMSSIYNMENEYDSSLYYAMKAYELQKKYLPEYAMGEIYCELSDIYGHAGNYQKAIEFGRKAYDIAHETKTPYAIQSASKVLYQAYEKTGNYKDAFRILEEYHNLAEELRKEENIKEILNQELEYEYEKQKVADSLAFQKEKELDELRFENELKTEAHQRYLLYGGLSFSLLLMLFAFFAFRRKKKDNAIISKQKQEVEEQKTLIEVAHTEIKDSINYAKRIQSAILPSSKAVQKHLKDSFILYKPKDVVAGDFYWLEKKEDQILIAAADCTGHGVPGAMVSVVCNNGLNRAVREYGLIKPGEILDKTRDLVIEEFEKSEEDVKDGMDISLCALRFNTDDNSTDVCYSGANNPLWIIRKGTDQIEEIKADKQPIGKSELKSPFTTHTTKLNSGDTIYLFSDGYADQFGGEKGKKLKSANFKKLLISIANESMEAQERSIDQAFEEWKGMFEQVDDVCVIGVRV